MKTKLFILIRRIAYITLGMLSRIFFFKERGIIIFCYHSIANDSWRFSVDFETLKNQIAHLLKHRQPISIDDLKLHMSGEKIIEEPSFLLTFDDGYADTMYAKNYFQKLGIKPVAFVLADSESANHKELDGNRQFLSVNEIMELKTAGWDIGCHSATHADFSKLSSEELQNEVGEAKAKLESRLGFPIKYFAYPKGKYSQEIIDNVKKAGYQYAFSMDNGYVSPNISHFTVPRIGVDRTHSFTEFRFFVSPAVMVARRLFENLL